MTVAVNNIPNDCRQLMLITGFVTPLADVQHRPVELTANGRRPVLSVDLLFLLDYL